MAVRFLHLSDLDLGARPAFLGTAAEARCQETLDTFRDAVGYALDPANRIDGVLISGNLFDRHRPPAEVWSFVRGLLGRLAAAQKTVVAIPGSRDSSAYKDSVYRTERFPGVDLITDDRSAQPIERTIGDQRVFFYGVAARPGREEEVFGGFQRSDEDGIHVGLVNGAVPEMPEWELRPHDLVVEPGVLSESGLDYVALGGYHGHARLRLEGTTAAYAGTLEGREFLPGDLGRKPLVVVEVGPGNVGFEEIPISRRTLEDWTLDLTSEQITDAAGVTAALVARSSKEVMARVTLTGSLEFLCDFGEIADSVRDRFAHLDLVDRTDLLQSALLRRIEGEATIRGYFVRRMLERLGDLEDRAATAPEDAPVHRELQTSRIALKLGLAQFLDEEPLPRIVEPGTRTAETAAAEPVLEVDEPEEAANNGRPREFEPAGRAQALLRSERQQHGEALSDMGGESA